MLLERVFQILQSSEKAIPTMSMKRVSHSWLKKVIKSWLKLEFSDFWKRNTPLNQKTLHWSAVLEISLPISQASIKTVRITMLPMRRLLQLPIVRSTRISLLLPIIVSFLKNFPCFHFLIWRKKSLILIVIANILLNRELIFTMRCSQILDQKQIFILKNTK